MPKLLNRQLKSKAHDETFIFWGVIRRSRQDRWAGAQVRNRGGGSETEGPPGLENSVWPFSVANIEQLDDFIFEQSQRFNAPHKFGCYKKPIAYNSEFRIVYPFNNFSCP